MPLASAELSDNQRSTLGMTGKIENEDAECMDDYVHS